MTTDTTHALTALASLGLLAAGAWRAWGDGYAMLIVGGLLLAGVIQARRGYAKPTD